MATLAESIKDGYDFRHHLMDQLGLKHGVDYGLYQPTGESSDEKFGWLSDDAMSRYGNLALSNRSVDPSKDLVTTELIDPITGKIVAADERTHKDDKMFKYVPLAIAALATYGAASGLMGAGAAAGSGAGAAAGSGAVMSAAEAAALGMTASEAAAMGITITEAGAGALGGLGAAGAGSGAVLSASEAIALGMTPAEAASMGITITEGGAGALGGGLGGAGGIASGATGQTFNPAIIDSMVGTPGYGASSAGPGGIGFWENLGVQATNPFLNAAQQAGMGQIPQALQSGNSGGSGLMNLISGGGSLSDYLKLAGVIGGGLAAYKDAKKPQLTGYGGNITKRVPTQTVQQGKYGPISRTSFAGGGYIGTPHDGMEDGIAAVIDGGQPAALSGGEFVIPADVVSHLGNGNSDAGAAQLMDMMERVRQARTGSTTQAREIDPAQFIA